jgi:hypothetical protein
MSLRSGDGPSLLPWAYLGGSDEPFDAVASSGLRVSIVLRIGIHIVLRIRHHVMLRIRHHVMLRIRVDLARWVRHHVMLWVRVYVVLRHCCSLRVQALPGLGPARFKRLTREMLASYSAKKSKGQKILLQHLSLTFPDCSTYIAGNIFCSFAPISAAWPSSLRDANRLRARRQESRAAVN